MNDDIKLGISVNTEAFVTEINEHLEEYLEIRDISLEEFGLKNGVSIEILKDLLEQYKLPEKTEDLMKIISGVWVTPVLIDLIELERGENHNV